MWLMLQHQPAEDFVICTGESHSLEEFVIAAFREVGLNWRDHVVVDHGLFRPSELSYGNGNPRKARKKLNWQAESKMRDVVKKMVEHEKTIRRES
jgi:GDPmannose 4,6-dehydratase